jgi:hypothetical protein
LNDCRKEKSKNKGFCFFPDGRQSLSLTMRGKKENDDHPKRRGKTSKLVDNLYGFPCPFVDLGIGGL